MINTIERFRCCLKYNKDTIMSLFIIQLMLTYLPNNFDVSNFYVFIRNFQNIFFLSLWQFPYFLKNKSATDIQNNVVVVVKRSKKTSFLSNIKCRCLFITTPFKLSSQQQQQQQQQQYQQNTSFDLIVQLSTPHRLFFSSHLCFFFWLVATTITDMLFS